MDLDARADAEERSAKTEAVFDDLSAEIEALKAQLEGRKAASSEVAVLEERFSDDPNNEKLRRELHLARVKAGWIEFLVDTASGVDSRVVIPWVATREVTWTEEWAGPPKTPAPSWLKPEASVITGGKVRKIGNHRICDDGKWRRDVIHEFDVVAVEDLAHLCSIVTRMEDMIVYKPDVTGLMTLTILEG